MSWTSIPHAHTYWRKQRAEINPPANLEDTEVFILSELPMTTEDVACILDVVCANGGDVRCDGLDRVALKRIHAFCSAREL